MQELAGANVNGRFYSPDAQAGRCAVLLLLGTRPMSECLPLFEAFAGSKDIFDWSNTDVVAFASIGNVSLAASSLEGSCPIRIVFATSDAIFAGSASRIEALVVDRSGRLIETTTANSPSEFVSRALAAVSLCAPSRTQSASAIPPILIVPNLIDRPSCAELIAHFEGGSYADGMMASSDLDGAGYSKRDLAKKRRQDLVLEPASPLHRQMVNILSARLVPEIKQAFNAEIAHLDRFLIARYDVGGCFFPPSG